MRWTWISILRIMRNLHSRILCCISYVVQNLKSTKFYLKNWKNRKLKFYSRPSRKSKIFLLVPQINFFINWFLFHLFYIYLINYEVSFIFGVFFSRPQVVTREQYFFQNSCWQKKIKWRRWPRTLFEEDEIKQWRNKINCRLVF